MTDSIPAGAISPQLELPEPVTDALPFDELRDAWAALHAASPTATPFAHPCWVDCWLRTLGGDAAPVFLAVRLDGELAGVGAFDSRHASARALGDPNLSDYPPLVAAPGRELAFAVGVLEWMREDFTRSLELWGIPEPSPLRAAFAAAAEALGWRLREERETVAPAASLEGGWDGFLQRLGKHERHELRRKIRNFERAGAATYEELVEPAAVEAGLELLLRLMRASHEGKARFLDAGRERFFRASSAAMAAEGLLRLGVLRLDGAAAAAVLCFDDGRATYLYNSGYEPELRRLAPGIVSKGLAIRAAAERGRERFDFLRGEEEYKGRLGGAPVPLLRIVLEAV